MTTNSMLAALCAAAFEIVLIGVIDAVQVQHPQDPPDLTPEAKRKIRESELRQIRMQALRKK